MENVSGVPPAAPSSPPGASPSEQVSLPGIFLMVLGAFGDLVGAMGLLQSALSKGDSVQKTIAELNDTLSSLGLGNQVDQHLIEQLVRASEKTSVMFGLFGMLLSAVVFVGGLQMRMLKMYPLALAACIIAMLPCYGWCCCIVGMPVGIWGLVLLLKPEIKNAFT